MFGFGKKKSAVDRHFEIVDALRSEKDEGKIIALCTEDISIVGSFKREWVSKCEKEADAISLKGTARKKYVALPPMYPSYNKLAIIYAKRKDYAAAISVCEEAIRAGFTGDTLQGGIKARMKALKEKQKKCQGQKSSV